MRNFLKIIGTAILFSGSSSSATTANIANNGLTQLSTKPLVDSPYAFDCKGAISGKNCSLVNKDKFRSFKSIGTGKGTTVGTAIAIDNSGNVYVTGYTTVGINGQQQHGNEDFFVIKYDSNHNIRWTQQVGAANGDTQGKGIATDSSGNVYVTGYTTAGISGQKQYGKHDYFLAKYRTYGDLQWVQQVGAASGYTDGTGVAIDNGGNIYITGGTSVGINSQQQHGNKDYFIAAYRTDGSLIWANQVGVAGGNTVSNAITIDNNDNVYITGSTDVGINGQLQNGKSDYLIVKYYRNSLQWARQYGISFGSAEANAITTDSNGDIYISGATDVPLGGQKYGIWDCFMVGYTASGTMQVTRQFGAYGGYTNSYGIATDSNDNVYIIGQTTVGINGKSQNGNEDYFVISYYNYNMKWIRQVGGPNGDTWGSGIAIDNSGDIYITGGTNVGLNKQSQNGLYDVFTTSYNPDNGRLLWSKQVGG